VRVTENIDVGLCAIQKGSPISRELSAFIQNMTNGYTEACQFDHNLRRIYALFTVINVAGNSGDRRDLLQLLDDGPLANVSGVEYMIDRSEVPQDRRVEQAVGIGDHTDIVRTLDVEDLPVITGIQSLPELFLPSVPLRPFIAVMELFGSRLFQENLRACSNAHVYLRRKDRLCNSTNL